MNFAKAKEFLTGCAEFFDEQASLNPKDNEFRYWGCIQNAANARDLATFIDRLQFEREMLIMELTDKKKAIKEMERYMGDV